MTQSLKEQVHALVDGLTNDHLLLVRDLLVSFGDDPFVQMAPGEQERLHAAIERSEREFDLGQGVSLDEIAADSSIV